MVETEPMLRSIRARLTAAFIGLAVGPLLVLGVVLSHQNYTVQRQQAFSLEQEVADRVASEVSGFILRLENELALMIRVRGLFSLTRTLQEQVLSELLSYENNFEELSLTDSKGAELVRRHHLDTGRKHPVNRSAGDAFSVPFRNGTPWYGPVRFDPQTAEPFMEISLPIPDLRTGRVKGILIANARLKKIWRLLESIPLRKGESIYILDARGRVVAHPNPSVVLRNTRFTLPDRMDGTGTGLSGTAVVLATSPIQLGDRTFIVVAERSTREAYSLAHSTARIIILLILASLAVAVSLIVVIVGNIIHPVQMLAKVAGEIEKGDLTRQAEGGGRDEVGALAQAFNRMTTRLRASMEHLEQEVRERKRAEKEVKATAQRLALHVDRTPLGVIEWDLDLRVTQWNPSAERIFGYSREEMIGRHAFETIVPRKLHAGIGELWEALLNRSGGVGSTNENITKSGEIRTCRWYNTTLVDNRGTVIAVASLVQDITERTASEATLRKYEHIVSASRDFLALLDRNYVYQAVNEAYLALHDRGREEIIGTSVADLLDRAVFEKSIKPFLDQCLDGKKTAFQIWLDYPGRGRRCMDVSCFPFLEKDQTVAGIVINSRDITRTKELESRLRQSQKMEAIGTLAGGIAHDFNNILSAVIGYTELAIYQVKENPRAGKYLSEVITAGKRARDLVKQILTFSRRGEPMMKPVKLSAIVEEALKLIRASIPATINIETRLTSEAVIVGDPTQIHQVLMNLCTNAAQAMEGKEGTITIALSDKPLDAVGAAAYPEAHPGPHVRLTVGDTGPGIEKAVLDRIFDPFFTTKEQGKGTGLGLSVVHGIITAHGGSITTESNPGRGTTFEILLPEAEVDESPESPAAAHPPTGTECILVVDDEKPVALVMKHVLESLGYGVVARHNGPSALEAFEQKMDRFDLVITDMTMPGMDGEELALRLMGLRPDLPVIICTGYSAALDEQKALEAGIRAFVQKPIMKQEIAETIRKVLGKQEV